MATRISGTHSQRPVRSDGYRVALTDWLACAHRGLGEAAARAAAGDALLERVAAAATAGHVLDFDDTYLPGIAHLSAATAPVAVVLGAAVDAAVGEAIDAYAAGFEAMGALARASHPHLYDRGWHPTAVCGAVGSAVTAAALLHLDDRKTAAAINLALLGAGGLRAAFGTDGKSLQVALAAVTGVQAARWAERGASTDAAVRAGPASFEAAYGGVWAEPHPDRPAIAENWIKRYPCCLQTHSAIEAAAAAAAQGATAAGEGTVTVHPVSRQAALRDDASTGLEAKFSIPYCVAFTVLHGPPALEAFEAVEPAARELAGRVAVRTDARLRESEARLEWRDGARTFRTRVAAATGSPGRPLAPAQLLEKARRLTGNRLDGVLDDRGAPARTLRDAAGL